MSDINSSLVSSELTTIETFKDTTEKRGSKLTLNELNYISDKQLHAKGGSGEDLLSEFPVVIEIDFRNMGNATDIDNAHARYLKGGYSEIRECPIKDDSFIVLGKLLKIGYMPELGPLKIGDENGVLFSNINRYLQILLNPDGTITFHEANNSSPQD